VVFLSWAERSHKKHRYNDRMPASVGHSQEILAAFLSEVLVSVCVLVVFVFFAVRSSYRKDGKEGKGKPRL